jgi:hypothetical protein
MRHSLQADHITLGVCYYPEHWDPSLWRDDLRRMKAAGIEVIRIAEFAWTIFEPRENEFTFEFFDSFMALALEEGMKVIFCTWKTPVARSFRLMLPMRRVMPLIVQTTDNVSCCRLNSAYNYTDEETRQYRYQAVFDLYYMEGE